MSQILRGIQPSNTFEKFWFWALMVAINVSVAICQFPIHQFRLLGKRSIGSVNEVFSK